MQRFLLIMMSVLMLVPVQSHAQKNPDKQFLRTEQKARQKSEMQNAIQHCIREKKFKIVISRIYPTESSSIQNLPTHNRYVSDGYFVELNEDLFSCNLPYIGVSRTAMIGSQNLSLLAKKQKVTVQSKYNKKSDSYVYQFEYTNENMNDKWSCTVELFTSGEANIRMQGISRDPISYRGEIQLSEKTEINLVPKPQSLVVKEGVFKITPNTKIISSDPFSGNYLRDKINQATQYNLSVTQAVTGTNTISLLISPNYNLPKEGYELTVTPKGITAKASDKAGAFYAVQTLLQLFPTSIYGNTSGFEKWEIPAVEIKDYPRFSYRGMHLDVSRTFFPLEVIYKYLDWLSYHKINTFHWHLTDDNGWRIEIKKYPFLTQKGAWRGPGEVLPASYGSGNKRYGGFYTQEEVKEVIQYAANRNIEIIPEFDMPGHSKSFIGAYPQVGCDNKTEFISVNGEVKNVLCIGKPDLYPILDDIMKEVAQLFPSKIIHIGGDEVNYDNWKECPTCQSFMKEKGMQKEIELLNYFVRQMEGIVNKYGKTMAGWDEILDGGELKKDTRVYAWRSIKKGIEAVRKGQSTVMQVAEFCYFDMKQTPLERGHNWAGIIPLEKIYSFDPIGSFEVSEAEQKLILGPQGGLWAELLNKPIRFMEYQNYPRICALAEVGWTNQSLRDFKDFEYRLTKTHYDRLFHMGIAFRLPYPDVVYEQDTLKITLPYDWAVVRYTTDSTEPNASSSIYTQDLVTSQPEKFRFATFYKDQMKSITVSAKNIETVKYLTPEVEITSSFGEQPKFPMNYITDYNFKTYWRTDRTGKKGDYVIYTLKEPVSCNGIILETGIPNIDLYGVTDGYVEYSYDGTTWIKGEEFIENVAKIIPDKKVKAVKIVFTDTSDALTVCFQDLRIY